MCNVAFERHYLEMSLNILFYGFFIVALAGQGQKCDDTMIRNATETLDTYIKEWFPRDIEFNESGVAEDCPMLKNISLCPMELDINALRDITQIISECMRRSICGIVIDPRPLRYLVSTLDELLPDLELKGVVTFPSGAGYLSNISDIQMELPANQNQHWPMQMTLLIPNIRIYGRFLFEFSLEIDSGPTLTANLDQSTYEIGVQFISTVVANRTTSGTKFDITFVNPTIKASPIFCGIDLPSEFPVIHTLMTTSLQMIYENSIMATALGQFMGRLYKAIFQVISGNCESKNAVL